MSSGILTSFLGALQASLAVLLTIGCGVIASRYSLLKESSARDISKVCVRLFLPALLIVNVGSELEIKTAARYIPVLSNLVLSLCSGNRLTFGCSLVPGIYPSFNGGWLWLEEDVQMASLDGPSRMFQ